MNKNREIENLFNEVGEEFKNGDFIAARYILKEIINLDPQSARAYGNLGVVENTLKNNEKAIEYCSKAISIDPKYSHAFHIRATVNETIGNNLFALADANEAIKLEPKNPIYYLGRIYIYITLKEYGSAAIDLVTAIDNSSNNNKINEDNIMVMCHKVALQFAQDEHFDEAIIGLTKLIELSPETQYYRNRAQVYLKNKSYKLAIHDYDKAIKNDPDQSEYYYFRGLCKSVLKDHKSARQDYVTAEELGYEYKDKEGFPLSKLISNSLNDEIKQKNKYQETDQSTFLERRKKVLEMLKKHGSRDITSEMEGKTSIRFIQSPIDKSDDND